MRRNNCGRSGRRLTIHLFALAEDGDGSQDDIVDLVLGLGDGGDEQGEAFVLVYDAFGLVARFCMAMEMAGRESTNGISEDGLRECFQGYLSLKVLVVVGNVGPLGHVVGKAAEEQCLSIGDYMFFMDRKSRHLLCRPFRCMPLTQAAGR